MLSRLFSRTRLQVSRSISGVKHLSISSLQAEQPEVNWQPIPFPKKQQTFEYDATEIAMQKKVKIQTDRALKKRKLLVPAVHLREGTNEEILQLEVNDLLTQSSQERHTNGDSKDQSAITEPASPSASLSKPPIDLWSEVELDIIELSSTGDGLAYTETKDHVVAVPFTVPGDRVLAKIYKWSGTHSHADFVKVIKPSAKREGVTPPCKYFADCGGCQFQMIPYQDQLVHKRTIVEKAFSKFSGLEPEKVPPVLDTMGSPLQYSYRTKLSPHFDGPGRRKGDPAKFTSLPKVGFNRKNRREVIDIEHCPIGTEVLQEGLKLERAKVAVNYKTYRNGKTILLRESTRREPDNESLDNNTQSPVAEFDTTSEPSSTELHHLSDGKPEITLNFPTHTDHKTYTSIETSLSTEYIGPHKFINRAGSFFQNNNSILGPFTKYVYDNCMLPAPSASSAETKPRPQIKYLLDAYCGSGLFTITLSKLFTSALGIDIDGRGIEAARENAAINNIPNAGFIEADASDLFADVPFPPDQSLVVIDPPRKGASEDFLRQLCQYRAKRVVYVSCNVHTQARDVGMIVNGFGPGSGCRYEIESLRGFDFFPQTGHVEGVCVLNRVEEA